MLHHSTSFYIILQSKWHKWAITANSDRTPVLWFLTFETASEIGTVQESQDDQKPHSRTAQNTAKDTEIAVKTHGTNWLVGPSWGEVEYNLGILFVPIWYMAPVGIPAAPSMVTELRSPHSKAATDLTFYFENVFPYGWQWDLIDVLQFMAGREDAWRIVEKMKWEMRVAGFNTRDRFHLQLM